MMIRSAGTSCASRSANGRISVPPTKSSDRSWSASSFRSLTKAVSSSVPSSFRSRMRMPRKSLFAANRFRCPANCFVPTGRLPTKPTMNGSLRREVEHPLVVLHPRAGLHDDRAGHRLGHRQGAVILGQHPAIEQLVLAGRPRHAFRAGRVVEMRVGVDDSEAATRQQQAGRARPGGLRPSRSRSLRRPFGRRRPENRRRCRIVLTGSAEGRGLPQPRTCKRQAQAQPLRMPVEVGPAAIILILLLG